jgi:hypothetical protein
MAKTLLSLPDLRYRALAEIRKQPGCSNVQGIAINRVSISKPRIIGRYVYHLRARLSQHGRPCGATFPKRFASRLRSDGGLTARNRGGVIQIILDVCLPVVRQ